MGNPIKTVKDPRKGQVERHGKPHIRTARVPLIEPEQQRAWLCRKLADIAELETLLINPQLPLFFNKKGRQRGKIQPVRFDGVLTVSDPDKMLAVLTRGIGPAKSFGCGMLSLAPV